MRTEIARLREREDLLQQAIHAMQVIEKLRGNAPLVSEGPAERGDACPGGGHGLKLINAIQWFL